VPGPISKPDKIVEAIFKKFGPVVVGLQPHIDLGKSLRKTREPINQPAISESRNGTDREHLLKIAMFEAAKRCTHSAKGIA
jgi:hypothetical protein